MGQKDESLDKGTWGVITGFERRFDMGIIGSLIIGAVAGWLAGLIMKGSGFGILGNIIVGLLGAFVGGRLFGLLRISAENELVGSLVTALVGAVVLLFIVGLVSKKKK